MNIDVEGCAINEMRERWRKDKEALISRMRRRSANVVAALNLRLEEAEFQVRMFKKYKHLDLEKLEIDYEYYDCVFMEHFEMNCAIENTEKYRLLGIEFRKMFERPEESDDSDDSVEPDYGESAEFFSLR